MQSFSSSAGTGMVALISSPLHGPAQHFTSTIFSISRASFFGRFPSSEGFILKPEGLEQDSPGQSSGKSIKQFFDTLKAWDKAETPGLYCLAVGILD